MNLLIALISAAGFLGLYVGTGILARLGILTEEA